MPNTPENKLCIKHGHKATWLDIHPDMKPRPEYFWGRYCGRCHKILKHA